MERRSIRVAVALIASGVMTTGVGGMELQGHRGARGVLPESSLPGFQHAIAAGADCLELDIAMTADGEIVITHDPSLNPDLTRKDGAWITERKTIKSLTVKQLKAYDIGRLRPDTAYARRFPEQKPIDGLRIPLLSELFELPEIKANTDVCLDIEIKTTPTDEAATFAPQVIADALLKRIDKPSLRARTRVRSFDWRGLAHIKRVAPEMPLAFLTAERRWLNNLEVGRPGKSPWLAGLDIDQFAGSAARAVKHLGGEIWAPYFGDLKKRDLVAAQELGLKVIVWTVNEAADIERMVRWGVDGITTDYPARARRIIDLRRADK
ncbi:MAG: glycerophosphodiester phosphodiesterase [Hyphomicrobiaceae bacterium]